MNALIHGKSKPHIEYVFLVNVQLNIHRSTNLILLSKCRVFIKLEIRKFKQKAEVSQLSHATWGQCTLTGLCNPLKTHPRHHTIMHLYISSSNSASASHLSSNHISNPCMDRSHAEQLRTAHDYHYGFQSTLQIYNHNANQHYYKSLQISFTTKSSM